MNAIRRLKPAINAYKAGQTWNQFWPTVAEQVQQAEPINVPAYHRVVRRLMALLVSGNTDGMMPVGDDVMPWAADDAQAEQHVDDTHTAAKVNWQAAGIARTL